MSEYNSPIWTPEQKSELQKSSAFTAIIYFKDGKGKAGRKFHSNNQNGDVTLGTNGKPVYNHERAFLKLVAMINKWTDKYLTAVIVENFNNKKVATWVNGEFKQWHFFPEYIRGENGSVRFKH